MTSRRWWPAVPGLALVLAAPAAGSADKTIRLELGDIVVVDDGPVGCFAGKDDVTHEPAIVCFLADEEGVIPGSYGTWIQRDGRVDVVRYTDRRGNATNVFTRKLQSAAAKPRVYQLDWGDAFLALEGTSISCSTMFPSVICSLFERGTLRPNSYSVWFADYKVGVYRVGPKGEWQKKPLLQKPQPKL